MGILPGSGPLGSGPTGPGSSFSVMPSIVASIKYTEFVSKLFQEKRLLQIFNNFKEENGKANFSELIEGDNEKTGKDYDETRTKQEAHMSKIGNFKMGDNYLFKILHPIRDFQETAFVCDVI